MAVMQEELIKFGVRTRKRNKSIKESAKLVNNKLPFCSCYNCFGLF